MNDYVLYGNPGWGSALVETQLAWYGLPFHIETAGDLFASADARQRLAALNPLAQVPTLVLPDGQVMTESAAITLHLADRAGRDDLVPGPQAAERPRFLRWLVFLVANLYPTFTYADEPTRFVKNAEAAAGFKDEVNAHQKRLWLMVEAEAGAPYLLGTRYSALDLYVAVMSHWRPGPAWFAEQAPRLTAIAAQTAALSRDRPTLAAVMQRNFPPT